MRAEKQLAFIKKYLIGFVMGLCLFYAGYVYGSFDEAGLAKKMDTEKAYLHFMLSLILGVALFKFFFRYGINLYFSWTFFIDDEEK